MRTRWAALIALLLALCLSPLWAGTAPPAAAVKDLRYYAWYWDGARDAVTYHQLTSFPVEDDLDEYPDFDVVATVANRNSDGPFILETMLAYQVGQVPAGESEASYARAKRQAVWSKPLWTKHTRVESIDAGSARPVRLAVVSTKDAIDHYWKQRQQHPYRARFTVVLKEGEGRKARVLGRLTRELAIDMLD